MTEPIGQRQALFNAATIITRVARKVNRHPETRAVLLVKADELRMAALVSLGESEVASIYPCCRHCAKPCTYAFRHGYHDRPCPHCAAGCTCRMDDHAFVAVLDPDCPVHTAAPETAYDHDDAPVAWRTRCSFINSDHDGPCEPRTRET